MPSAARARADAGYYAVGSTCADHHIPPVEHRYSWPRYDYFNELQKTHRQLRCAECGRWAVWVPKETGE